MDVKRSESGMIEIDGKVRIEAGPRRRHEVATEALLSDAVTAAHYAVGKLDAHGRGITLGKKFHFIDWKSPDRVFTVCKLTDVEDTVDGKKVKLQRFLPQGEHESEAAALSQ